MKKAILTFKNKKTAGLKLFCFIALLLSFKSSAFCEDKFLNSEDKIDRWKQPQKISLEHLDIETPNINSLTAKNDIPLPSPSVIFYISTGALLTRWLRQRKGRFDP